MRVVRPACTAVLQANGQQPQEFTDGERPDPDSEAGTLDSGPTAAEEIAAQQTDPMAR